MQASILTQAVQLLMPPGKVEMALQMAQTVSLRKPVCKACNQGRVSREMLLPARLLQAALPPALLQSQQLWPLVTLKSLLRYDAIASIKANMQINGPPCCLPVCWYVYLSASAYPQCRDA